MFPNTPMSTAAEKVEAHLAKTLQIDQKTKPASTPDAQILASMPKQSSQQKVPSPAVEILAAYVTAIVTRNNANLKGKSK